MKNTESILNNIKDLKKSAKDDLKSLAKDIDSLENWRIDYLGRNGQLSSLMKILATIPNEDKKIIGPKINQLKVDLNELFSNRKDSLDSNFSSIEENYDISLPGRKIELGNYHPTTLIIREICNAFASMGFEILEGNEIETEKYNFDLLNIPSDHPARDQWDTIWLNSINQDNKYLLRTHTSPMQARIMEQKKPPIRVVVPGKCYRYEATDATHEWEFHQIEGLAIDKKISFSELKGTLFEMARKIFGSDQKVRFRCDFFPFVEPGVDMSILWDGKWIEILGAGMVHPKVLTGVGYDPTKYSGFAFGIGPERVSMLKNKIKDIRNFHLNDLRFLSQFVK
ncbi:MAG: phenylalanine--tRNA ligase subunit alpha [Dehalococcoidia bacterium]|nr:phenylalanine--tRNA ligase subunit alpha [Dehalococcoidia bacterium]